MGLYYHYATLVIAATGAQDSHGGLFEPRRLFARKTDMPIFDLPSFTEDGVQDGWFHMATMPSLQGTHPALSKLATRAWFYQEWALARRVAFFTPSQLVWRCQGEYRTEAIADEHTRDDYWEDEPEQCRHAYEIVNTKWDIGHFDNAQWMRDISEYNCRALTYELNRAHAFQGVANMFSQRYRPSYAFGHWVEDMPSSLLWSKPRSTGPNRFERRAEIPTWSCFSVSGPIEVDSIIFRNTEYLNDASKETAEESSGSSSHTREVAWISPYKEKIIGSVTAAEKQLNIKSSALLLERAVAPTSNALCYVLRPFNPDATIPASTTPGPSVLGQRGQNPYNYRRLGLLDYDIRWGNPELPREILPGVLNVPKHGICLDIAQEESPSHMLLVLIQEVTILTEQVAPMPEPYMVTRPQTAAPESTSLAPKVTSTKLPKILRRIFKPRAQPQHAPSSVTPGRGPDRRLGPISHGYSLGSWVERQPARSSAGGAATNKHARHNPPHGILPSFAPSHTTNLPRHSSLSEESEANEPETHPSSWPPGHREVLALRQSLPIPAPNLSEVFKDTMFKPSSMWKGLVLAPVPEAIDRWRRVGTGHIFVPAWTTGNHEEWSTALGLEGMPVETEVIVV